MMSLKRLWTWMTSVQEPSHPPPRGYARFPRYKKVAQFLCVPCSESSTRPCHVLDQLHIWNMIMYLGDMELEEVSPGRLELFQTLPSGVKSPKQSHYHEEMTWLLREHRCIKALTLKYDVDPVLRNLLHCTLLVNQGLKKLVLGSHDDKHGTFAVETILSLVSAVTEVEELELHCRIDDSAVVQQLGTALCKISSLKSIKMHRVVVSPTDVECVLRVFKSNPNIAVISVQDFFLRPRVVLADFAAFCKNLTVLDLWRSSSIDACDLEDLFEVLASGHHLEELCLEEFVISGRTLELLAKMAAQQGTLKCLKVKCHKDNDAIDGVSLAKLVGKDAILHELMFLGDKVNCLSAFGEALGVNTSLKKLSLRLVNVDVHDLELFLKAFACNKSLLRVTVTDVPEELVSILYQLLLEVGLEERIKFDAEFRDPLVFASALKKCTKLPRIKYNPCSTEQDPFPDSLCELINYHNLVSLTIKLETEIGSESVANLAIFLSSTKTLSSAELLFPTTLASTLTLLDGISRNSSLSVLRLAQWTMDPAGAEVLWRVVGSSKTLNELYITNMNGAMNLKPMEVPQCIVDNYCLIRVVIDAPSECLLKCFMYRLVNSLFRNRTLLRRATQFVMGSRDKGFAEAFEKVVGSPALVERVQESAGVSKEQAMERVMGSRCFLV